MYSHGVNKKDICGNIFSKCPINLHINNNDIILKQPLIPSKYVILLNEPSVNDGSSYSQLY